MQGSLLLAPITLVLAMDASRERKSHRLTMGFRHPPLAGDVLRFFGECFGWVCSGRGLWGGRSFTEMPVLGKGLAWE